jgi:hypothetical protein
MKRGLLCFFAFLMATTGLPGAVPIEISEEFFNEDIVVFYLSDFNLENPQGNPLIFEYYIGNKNYPCIFPEPVQISLEFYFKARIRALGWTNFQPIVTIVLNPFTIAGPCRISNQIISSNISNFFIPYDCPAQVNTGSPYVDLNGGQADVDNTAMSRLSNSILSTGQLPAGTYSFLVRMVNEGSGQVSEISKNIQIVSPTSLELIGPGNLVHGLRDFESQFNRFPMFQWESEACASCNYAIRICEYVPGIHASPYDAMMDEAILPFPDDGDFYDVGNNITVLNYDPALAGRDLEFGKYYVWQVEKTFETSGGIQNMKSEIFGFFLEDPSSKETARHIINPVEELLKELVGEDQFETLKAGQLSGYQLSGMMSVNGRPITVEELRTIVNGIQNGSYTIQNVFVE